VTDNPTDFSTELSTLRQEVVKLNARLRPSLARRVGLQFLSGVAWGLGSILGATLVVSTLIYSLASIDFIPIIGEWAVQIADRIKQR